MTPFQVIWLAGSVPREALLELFDASANAALARTDLEIAQINADEAIAALILATNRKHQADKDLTQKMNIHGVGK